MKSRKFVTFQEISVRHPFQYRLILHMIGSMNATSPLSQEVWERTPAEAQAYIRALAARVAALEATVQRLLERLRMDSQHASQLPSSDAPTTRRPRQRRTPSGRKPGGQPGPGGGGTGADARGFNSSARGGDESGVASLSGAAGRGLWASGTSRRGAAPARGGVWLVHGGV